MCVYDSPKLSLSFSCSHCLYLSAADISCPSLYFTQSQFSLLFFTFFLFFVSVFLLELRHLCVFLLVKLFAFVFVFVFAFIFLFCLLSLPSLSFSYSPRLFLSQFLCVCYFSCCFHVFLFFSPLFHFFSRKFHFIRKICKKIRRCWLRKEDRRRRSEKEIDIAIRVDL